MISRLWIVSLILGAPALNGCGAVLTESQLTTTHAFATASADYPSLPPKVFDAYAKVREQRVVLGVAVQRLDTEAMAREAMSKLEKSTDLPNAFHQKSSQVSAALAVLSTYSELLQKLTSDDSDNSLTEDAKHLGASLDDAARRYNAAFNTELPLVGAIAGAFVRGATGLFLRAKQAQFVQAYVRAARPVVKALTADIWTLVAPYSASPPSRDESPFLKEKNELQNTYVADFETYKGTPLPLEHVQAFDSWLHQMADAQQLADDTLTATATYSQAHEKLANALETKVEIKQGIGEIQVLAQELKAARTVKGRVEDENK